MEEKTGIAYFEAAYRRRACVRLDGCNKRNAVAGSFQFAIDAEMVAAKSAGPGNGDAKDGLACYFVTPALPRQALCLQQP
jgi:hypothetical protein